MEIKKKFQQKYYTTRYASSYVGREKKEIRIKQ